MLNHRRIILPFNSMIKVNGSNMQVKGFVMQVKGFMVKAKALIPQPEGIISNEYHTIIKIVPE
jgi:hypothetical protein